MIHIFFLPKVLFYGQVSFTPNWSIGKIHAVVDKSATQAVGDHHDHHRKVLLQCIPITTLLLALNVTHVDYFSLDIEGSEMDVLSTIDFDRFEITV
jgi:Methyltransferase FkbM domain